MSNTATCRLRRQQAICSESPIPCDFSCATLHAHVMIAAQAYSLESSCMGHPQCAPQISCQFRTPRVPRTHLRLARKDFGSSLDAAQVGVVVPACASRLNYAGCCMRELRSMHNVPACASCLLLHPASGCASCCYRRAALVKSQVSKACMSDCHMAMWRRMRSVTRWWRHISSEVSAQYQISTAMCPCCTSWLPGSYRQLLCVSVMPGRQAGESAQGCELCSVLDGRQRSVVNQHRLRY